MKPRTFAMPIRLSARADRGAGTQSDAVASM